MLGVAQALATMGADVRVATGGNRHAMVRDLGLRPVALPRLAPTPQDHDLAHLFWRRPVEMAPPLAELLRPFAPDVVVADVLTHVGGFVAERFGVPWVELHTHHLVVPDPLVPPIGLGRAPSRAPWRRLDDALVRARADAARALGEEQRRAARRDLTLPGTGGPARRLVATLPALEHPRRRWPTDAWIVGEVQCDPPWPPLEPPPGDGPLVVVTDTTATAWTTGLGARVLAALADEPDLRVVVTSDELAPRREERLVVGRGPHGPLLDVAAAAVAPGGHGFVVKALARGVPLVVVHGPNDQRETAARVAHTGAGIALRPRRGHGRRLRHAIRAVVDDPAYPAAARAVAAGASALGPRRAAELVLDLVAPRATLAAQPLER